MPWILIRSVDKHLYKMAMKMNDGYSITVKSFKKDRIVTIKRAGNNFEIYEDGFKKERLTVDENALKKAIKDIIDFEYPKSHELMVTEQSAKP
ncbi:MAG: hypothetical protein M1125_00295 [Candidatus Marsarchaeota archaeon]|nr:hypothetical protein [Candidatus Marsarchaeota archaeon]